MQNSKGYKGLNVDDDVNDDNINNDDDKAVIQYLNRQYISDVGLSLRHNYAANIICHDLLSWRWTIPLLILYVKHRFRKNNLEILVRCLFNKHILTYTDYKDLYSLKKVKFCFINISIQKNLKESKGSMKTSLRRHVNCKMLLQFQVLYLLYS